MSNNIKPTTSKEEKLAKIVHELGVDKILEEIGADEEIPLPYTDKYLSQFITVDPETKIVKAKIRRLATRDYPVLLIGETGTGKELLAQALHGNRKGSFVAVNTAGIPDTLLESEMFGVDSGAFTGSRTKPGLLEEAANGTVFLDEIGDMPLLLQCKLLRIIQERKARRLGATKDYDVTCRFVAATNKTRQQLEIFGGTFRTDLFYRFKSILQIKPLKERLNDIAEICKSRGFDVAKLPPKEWRGNVRELLNFIEEQETFEGLD